MVSILEPLNNINWPELQNLFRQRYSKVVVCENNYFMQGDHLVLMKIQKP